MKLITDHGIEVEFEKVQALEIRKGEVLVLTADKPLSDISLAAIRDGLKKIFKDTHLIFLESGMKFTILREHQMGESDAI